MSDPTGIALTETAGNISQYLFAGFAAVCTVCDAAGMAPADIGRNALISVVGHIMMVAAHDPELYEWLRYQVLADAPLDMQRKQAESMAHGLRRIREASAAS